MKLEVTSFQYEPGEVEIAIANYTLVSYENSTIEIQVEFEHPELLSLDRVRPDVLLATFRKQISSREGHFLPLVTELVITIPQQLEQNVLEEAQKFQEAISNPIVTLTILQIGLSVVAGAGIKHMWNAINVLQFIVYYPDWQIIIPPMAGSFLVVLKNLAFFIFIQDIAKSALNEFEEGCQGNEESSLCKLLALKEGLSSSSFVEDAGVMILGAAVLVAALVGVGFLFIIGKMSTTVAKFYVKIKELLFFNTFIRYVL